MKSHNDLVYHLMKRAQSRAKQLTSFHMPEQATGLLVSIARHPRDDAAFTLYQPGKDSEAWAKLEFRVFDLIRKLGWDK